MNKLLLSMASAVLLVSPVAAQHYDMSQWGADRGYTQAPYFRYEAEPGFCQSYSGTHLAQSDVQTDLQSEASNQQAITITNGGRVTWLNDTGDADGLTLRFSVPWAQQATVGIYAGDDKVGEMSLNTDHSWEFCTKTKGNRYYKPEYYSRHVFNADEAVRMRFDETHKLLSRAIRKGEQFSIRHLSGAPVTVDFVEIEKAHKVEYQDGWVRWNQQIKNNLQEFINEHQGQTIYIDQEYVGVWGKLSPGNCTLQGRGMFYTELHWEQNGAGFNSFGGQVKDMYLSSYQNQRYDSPDHGPNGYGSPGKCFNGSVGRVERVWVEHFECGGWLSGANSAYFGHCRFRNNYADGINFCNSSNCTFEQSSFRNNGDDDMASWSAEGYCSNNTFRYCTAEHNWRASSLGFFGGGRHNAHNILVKDGLESGVRLCSDFSGPAFGEEGIDFSDISIVHCACINGEVGVHGDFWGVDEGALHIEASNNYSLVNPRFVNFDIYDSRGNAVFIGANPNKSHQLNNVSLDGINVYGVRDDGSYAFYFENPKGSAKITNVKVADAENVTNFNGGSLESGSQDGFNLTVADVDLEGDRPVEITGIVLRLNGVSWGKTGRDASSELREGDHVTFQVRVENNSDVHLPETTHPVRVAFKFSDGSTIYTTKYTGGLKANNGVVLTADWTAKPGGHTVTAVLDPSGTLGSMVAGDGTAQVSKRFNVSGGSIDDLTFDTTSGVDFQVLDLVWRRDGTDEKPGKGPINPGDRVIFSAVLANTGTENSTDTRNKLGVTFRKDNIEYGPAQNNYLWCDGDPSFQVLNAGEKKLFEATGRKGVNGNEVIPYWTAENGNNSFTVHANDGGQRSEDNKGNNSKTFTIPVPYTGLMMNEFVDEPDNLNHTPTSLISVDVDNDNCVDGLWYTISGMVMKGAPAQPGIYIHNGRKVVVK